MSRAYKLWLLGSLYLAQGLPYGFFTQALPVLMREQGASLKAISATGLLFLPWALKFLWAPLVDGTSRPRQWLLPLQAGTVIGAALLAYLGISPGTLAPVMVALLLFNLAAAAQDVVTDGLAVRMLGPRERGLANGIQVGAYRIGMILGGGFLLWVYARYGSHPMFAAMAALLLVMSLPVLWLRDRSSASAAAVGLAPGEGLVGARRPERTAKFWAGWLVRLRRPGTAGFIALVCLYKFGDTMGAAMVGPFLKDLAWSTEAIALMKGTVGSTVSLCGAALGGWLAFTYGRRATLLGCGLLQSASLLAYLAAALGLGGSAMLWLGCVAEHLFGSMATVALFTLMMDACDPEHASTDYSLMACAIVIAQGLALFTGGVIGDALGWAALFGGAALLSTLGCIALVLALDRRHGPARLQPVWAAPHPQTA